MRNNNEKEKDGEVEDRRPFFFFLSSPRFSFLVARAIFDNDAEDNLQ